MNENENRKITETTEYTVDKMKFIVSPSFKSEGSETLKAILLRLIKAETEKSA